MCFLIFTSRASVFYNYRRNEKKKLVSGFKLEKWKFTIDKKQLMRLKSFSVRRTFRKQRFIVISKFCNHMILCTILICTSNAVQKEQNKACFWHWMIFIGSIKSNLMELLCVIFVSLEQTHIDSFGSLYGTYCTSVVPFLHKEVIWIVESDRLNNIATD